MISSIKLILERERTYSILFWEKKTKKIAKINENQMTDKIRRKHTRLETSFNQAD